MTQLLIYESVVPLSARRHSNGAVEIRSSYDFSGKINSVPLMAIEFPFAACEYPIVFAGTKENFIPAVILGMRDSQNLYLSPEAKWEASRGRANKQRSTCAPRQWALCWRYSRNRYSGGNSPVPHPAHVDLLLYACLSLRSSMNRIVNGRPATAFPSASVNGKGVQRLSICATAIR
jgi:hypothetical protein